MVEFRLWLCHADSSARATLSPWDLWRATILDWGLGVNVLIYTAAMRRVLLESDTFTDRDLRLLWAQSVTHNQHQPPWKAASPSQDYNGVSYQRWYHITSRWISLGSKTQHTVDLRFLWTLTISNQPLATCGPGSWAA